jgi:hypothetical protein
VPGELISVVNRRFGATNNTDLHATTTKAPKSRIEQASTGVAIVPPGNNELFDPDAEGMLGNTSSSMALVHAGLNYQHISTDAPTSATTDAQHW